jgi:hypothetical protein
MTDKKDKLMKVKKEYCPSCGGDDIFFVRQKHSKCRACGTCWDSDIESKAEQESFKIAEEIKQKIAIENGFDNWEQLLEHGDMEYIPDCVDEAIKTFARQSKPIPTEEEIKEWAKEEYKSRDETQWTSIEWLIYGANWIINNYMK